MNRHASMTATRRVLQTCLNDLKHGHGHRHQQQYKRRVATKGTESLHAPSMLFQVANIEFNSMPRGRTPACGWRKSIVSSAPSYSAMADLDIATTSMHTASSSSAAESVAGSSTQSDPLGTKLKLDVDMDELSHLASLRCTPLSLKDMYKYAVDVSDSEQRLRNAQFLHKELPIRIAQRAVDLLTLPHGLSELEPIQAIVKVYLQYLEQFQEFPVPTTQEEEERFTDMLEGMVLDRSSIPNAVAQGVDKWLAEHYGSHPATEDSKTQEQSPRIQEMENALYRYFTARTGLRFLTEHHILSSPSRQEQCASLRNSQCTLVKANEKEDLFCGCIQTDCDPAREVRRVVASIRQQTEDFYGICPEIQIVDAAAGNAETKFTYVPHHLHYMVGELIKNSCRAVSQKYLDSDQSSPIPPIRVVISKGKEDVTVKIADRGGGIPRSKMSTIFQFAHSTATKEESASDFGVDETTGTKIRGFGLPLARVYARYLGGELTLKSMEGYGLDAYLHLPRLGDSCENLPLPVKYSPGELNSNPPRRAISGNSQ